MYLENKRIFVSRDVHFFEHIFSFVDKFNDIPSSIFLDYHNLSTDHPDSQIDPIHHTISFTSSFSTPDYPFTSPSHDSTYTQISSLGLAHSHI